jgi:TPP-dependent pyruvate/acetoin dehydrogenase alpha subunit
VPFHVGAGLVATGEDLIVAGRHDTALFLLSGVSPGRILAGLLGRGAEPFAGRDAGLRFAIGPCRLIPTASHDAQGIPVAAGAALAFKREGKGRVALAFFEETSVFRGDFHEGINFAAVQDLPVVYVASRRAGAGEAGAGDRSLVERAVAYDIPALSVDGEDALAVHETVGRAVLRARRGGGPTVVEGLLGAAGGEGGAGASMRRAEEGPVETFARRLAEEKVLDGKAFDAMRAELGREVEEAARWALEQPWPVAGEATEGVRVGLAGGPAVREERTGD